MSEFDSIQQIKAKLDAYQAETPGFDGLFGDEVIGETRLREVCQSKLADYVAVAPSFEGLMQPVRHVIRPRIKRKTPLWSFVAAAAASLAFFLLFPELSEMNQDTMGLLNETISEKPIQKFGINKTRTGETFLTQKLNTPKTIKQVGIQVTPETMADNSAEKDAIHVDSVYKETFEKITNENYANLDVANTISIEEAYARARATKRHQKHDKLLAGIRLNSANRLLSFVNTNQGSNPMQAAANNYSEGLSTMDGYSTSMLRTATVSRNVWTGPENIPSDISSFEARYSMPLNAGLSISLPITSMLELQTGFTYTYLSSKTSGITSTSTFELRRELHYIGIPVNLAITLHESNRFRFYAGFGGTLEKGLVGIQKSIVETSTGDVDTWTGRQKVYGVQPLANGLLGLSFEIAPSFILYAEPGANYCFPGDQPISSRTEEPFHFNLGFGLRYRLN